MNSDVFFIEWDKTIIFGVGIYAQSVRRKNKKVTKRITFAKRYEKVNPFYYGSST